MILFIMVVSPPFYYLIRIYASTHENHPLSIPLTTSENHILSADRKPERLYAEVVVNIPLNKVFHYTIPQNLKDHLTAGMRVKIPFGGKIITGFCVGFTNISFPYPLKDIITVVDKAPLTNDIMLKLTRWLSSHYYCGWGEAIHAVVPPVIRSKTKDQWTAFVKKSDCISEIDHNKLLSIRTRAPKQARALEILLESSGEIPVKELIRISGCTKQGLLQLERKGFLIIENKLSNSRGPSVHNRPIQQHLTFTEEQHLAFKRIHERLKEAKPGVVLLHGITGSGKTEIYLQTITKIIEQGRKVIFLVPEISLTSQTIQRIRARFSRTAVLHSHLLESYYHSQWNDVKENKIDIVLGARSSVFCPLKNVGLIIIDEEHENTYKQENTPRYHARDIAVRRAAEENALVLLGTATPALESYYSATQGVYERLVLSKRIGECQLPRIEIVDMREEVRKRRGYHIISQRLEYSMNQALAKNEQIILFLNRRGFAPYIHCKRCGFVLKCQQCDIPMTLHKNPNIVLCHYCHAEVFPPEFCPDCLDGHLNYRGFGTEKIEDVIAARFPHRKVARMDSDSMRRRNAHEKILMAFERREIDILIGTQMIAKGLDFPNVTLVGVISADTMLNIPDFRASERTFQLIAQVAGRAGRGSKGGCVIVQSFTPKHYSITYAAAHDYEGFAKKELEYRKQLNYPPFRKLARIVFRSPKEDNVREKALTVADTLKGFAQTSGDLEILGPSPAPLMKINTLFRWHLFLRSESYTSIHNALYGIENMLKPSKSVQAMVDVDPYMML
ncbi:MAG: primosomal protein N' [wastewater metagenome]|nr:primosomal protein N' [Candidatus Loosdrechtia aerotolerans]